MLLSTLWGGCATIEPSATTTVGPGSSWEEIRGTPGLILQPQQIPFGIHWVSVTDLCLRGDTLRATTADGTVLEKPAAGIPRDYQVGVGRVVGNGEESSIRILFRKPFTIPTCR